MISFEIFYGVNFWTNIDVCCNFLYAQFETVPDNLWLPTRRQQQNRVYNCVTLGKPKRICDCAIQEKKRGCDSATLNLNQFAIVLLCNSTKQQENQI